MRFLPRSLIAIVLSALITITGCEWAGSAMHTSVTGQTGSHLAKPSLRGTVSAIGVSSTRSKPLPRSAELAAQSVPKPHIVWDPIPFGPRRRAEMAAYVRRHYSSFMAPTDRLSHPHVIVIHYTETPDFQATYNTFAPDHPDPELHELPNTCAHFVIDRRGVIFQLVPVSIMCRHTVGLNWTAIGIEHVGYSDWQVLGNAREMAASLSLVRWLRCRLGIPVANVIGHNESLSSPFHREDVAALRGQTHSDFKRADMRIYRDRLQRAGACPTG